jgi:hypothetical protein
MSDLVERIWDGPFDAFLPNMSVLHRGDKHLITEEQALSGHWKTEAPGMAPTPAFTPSAPTPSTTSAGAD